MFEFERREPPSRPYDRAIKTPLNPFYAFQAAQVMDVKQIRRIYDITNVLEGIGLIVKKSKNTVQWRWVVAMGNQPAVF